MKMMRAYGGQAVAVYQKSNRAGVEKLLQDGRVDFIFPRRLPRGNGVRQNGAQHSAQNGSLRRAEREERRAAARHRAGRRPRPGHAILRGERYGRNEHRRHALHRSDAHRQRARHDRARPSNFRDGGHHRGGGHPPQRRAAQQARHPRQPALRQPQVQRIRQGQVVHRAASAGQEHRRHHRRGHALHLRSRQRADPRRHRCGHPRGRRARLLRAVTALSISGFDLSTFFSSASSRGRLPTAAVRSP